LFVTADYSTRRLAAVISVAAAVDVVVEVVAVAWFLMRNQILFVGVVRRRKNKVKIRNVGVFVRYQISDSDSISFAVSIGLS